MRGFVTLALCAISVSGAYGQSSGIQPVQVSAGAVVSFYSQTRLNPESRNVLDDLPKRTVLKVRLLDAIDSNVDRDGLEFRGSLMTPLAAGNEVIVHAEAEVHGLLVLLRSRNHPDGFRYELLITSISDNGKSYELTASLNPSFLDAASTRGSHPVAEAGETAKEPVANTVKLPAINKN
jgi:hypothetical protein